MLIWDRNVNPIERELANAIEESSVHDDAESNMHSRGEFEISVVKKAFPGKKKPESQGRLLQINLTYDFLEKWTHSMVAMMHSQINKE